MNILAKLFSSDALVKIMRLFLMNPEGVFDNKTIAERCRIKSEALTIEINLLKKIGFIKQKSFMKTATLFSRIHNNSSTTKKQIKGWTINEKFPFIGPLRNLLIESELIKNDELVRRIRVAVGNVKLLVLSGIFLEDTLRKVDLLVIGDNLKKKAFEKTITTIESEIGTELRYSIFSTKEFTYRSEMHDKLLRDVFDYPHQVLVNKFGKDFSKKK